MEAYTDKDEILTYEEVLGRKQEGTPVDMAWDVLRYALGGRMEDATYAIRPRDETVLIEAEVGRQIDTTVSTYAKTTTWYKRARAWLHSHRFVPGAHPVWSVTVQVVVREEDVAPYWQTMKTTYPDLFR